MADDVGEALNFVIGGVQFIHALGQRLRKPSCLRLRGHSSLLTFE